MNVDFSKRWVYIRYYYIKRKEKPGTGSRGDAAKKRFDLLSFLDGLSSSQRSTITNVFGDESSENTNANETVATENDTRIDNEESVITQKETFWRIIRWRTFVMNIIRKMIRLIRRREKCHLTLRNYCIYLNK
uniref:(California timema) hypothetical protein n=1 Tax=Timema californicum TaxID=61474 RepID=A0A7R9JH01_TIMCA|nr:unnamed protein product [Timema californicum]